MSDDSKAVGLSRFATIFFIACFALLAFFLYQVFEPFFSTLVWATALTVIFQPLFRKLEHWTRAPRAVAALLTCLLILILIVLPITLLGVLLTQQTISLYQDIQTNLQRIEAQTGEQLHALEQRPWLRWVLEQAGGRFGLGALDVKATANEVLTSLSKFVIAKGPSLLAGVGGVLYTFLMTFITMFFLFRDGPAIVRFVRASNPLPTVYESEIIKRFQDVSYATFFGSLFTALVQGSAGGMLFWILGIPAPLFWTAVIAFVSLVPMVGAFLVWGPVSAYLWIAGETGRALGVLLIGGLVVSSIDNVLKPMIIKGRTNMHPLLVFLSVLGGLDAFGFLGILLGPLFVAVFLSFLDFYRLEFRHLLQEKRPGAGQA
jgi:predicted PurR-regulated permease PerM